MCINNKVRTTININKKVVEQAKELGINISGFTELKLAEHIARLKEMDLSGFEPEASSMPRRRSSELIYKPNIIE